MANWHATGTRVSLDKSDLSAIISDGRQQLRVVDCSVKKFRRGVEQLVARRAHNPEVAGSNPAPATIFLY